MMLGVPSGEDQPGRGTALGSHTLSGVSKGRQDRVGHVPIREVRKEDRG